MRSRKADAAYWRTLPYEERLSALKQLHQDFLFGNTVLNQDFKEFIQSLNDNQIRYLVIGGYTVGRLQDLTDLENLDE